MSSDHKTTEAVYKFIVAYYLQYHFSPTMREIAEGCFISSPAVRRHLDRLECDGRIEREPNRARSIVLIERIKRGESR